MQHPLDGRGGGDRSRSRGAGFLSGLRPRPLVASVASPLCEASFFTCYDRREEASGPPARPLDGGRTHPQGPGNSTEAVLGPGSGVERQERQSVRGITTRPPPRRANGLVSIAAGTSLSSKETGGPSSGPECCYSGEVAPESLVT